MARLTRRGRQRTRDGQRPVPDGEAPRTSSPTLARSPWFDQHALHQHHPAGGGARLPGRRDHREANPALHQMERRRHGHQGEPPFEGHRRSPLLVRILGAAVRGRVQSLLPGQGQRDSGRRRVHPGPRLARDLRPRLPRGTPRGASSRRIPPRDRHRRAQLVSPPPVDARLLGIPDGLDGHRTDELAVSRPIQQVPPQPGPR